MKIKLGEGAFLGIIAAVAEMYKKECYGLIIGKRRGQTIKIAAVAVAQKAKRTFSSISFADRYIKSFRDIVEDIPKCDLIGEFHSHAQFGKLRAYAILSKHDLKTCCEAVQLVISANDSKAKKRDFTIKPDGTIAGTINHVAMLIRAFYVEDDKPTKLPITCNFLK